MHTLACCRQKLLPLSLCKQQTVESRDRESSPATSYQGGAQKLRGRLYTVEVFVGIEVFDDFPELYNGFEVFVGLGAAGAIQSDHLACESTRITKE